MVEQKLDWIAEIGSELRRRHGRAWRISKVDTSSKTQSQLS